MDAGRTAKMARCAGRGRNTGAAGILTTEEVDVAALFAQLREEVRRLGPRSPGASGPSAVRLNARAVAERLWPVSADRPTGRAPGLRSAVLYPVKLVLGRLQRPYVEPVFADQRAFNDALLKLIDDLQERVDRLEAERRTPGAAESS